MSKVNNDPNPRKAVRMPFGSHKGEFLSEVPIDYLNWIADTNTVILDEYLRTLIGDEIKRRDSARPGAGKVIKKGESK